MQNAEVELNALITEGEKFCKILSRLWIENTINTVMKAKIMLRKARNTLDFERRRAKILKE